MAEETQDKLYLVQGFPNGDFYVYDWTPTLAQKVDMKVVRGEEAEKLLRLQRKACNNIKYLGKESHQATISATMEAKERAAEKESQSKQIIDKMLEKANGEDYGAVEEVVDLDPPQDKILLRELGAIKSMKKGAIEAHMLEKYRMEMPPGLKTEEMRQHASAMLDQLSKEDKLYLIDGEV